MPHPKEKNIIFLDQIYTDPGGEALRAAAAPHNVLASPAFRRLNHPHLVHLPVGGLGIIRRFAVIIHFAAWAVRHMHVHGQGEGYLSITDWALHDSLDYSKARLKVEPENTGQ